jgi:hypothetical protein
MATGKMRRNDIQWRSLSRPEKLGHHLPYPGWGCSCSSWRRWGAMTATDNFENGGVGVLKD